MHISKIETKNFRMLENIELLPEEQTTLVVGRNNSGKTSLTEIFRRLLEDDKPSFQLEDFSFACHEKFLDAFKMQQNNIEESVIRDTLPFIEVKLTIQYEEESPDLGTLGDFIIDLNPVCTEAAVVIRYEIGDGKISELFKELPPDVDKNGDNSNFFQSIKERVPMLYIANLNAVDPNDPNNKKRIEKLSKLRCLLKGGYINAQRGLDDTTHKDKGTLSKILEALFNNAKIDRADEEDQKIFKKLKDAVQKIQSDINTDFNKQLEGLLPSLEKFGYPWLEESMLRTETLLDVDGLLSGHTKIRYGGANGISLPETYNGLGARNLIFILLKLVEFFKSFKTNTPAPGVHLVFIEEPEAHLHPQMQEIFIRQLEIIAKGLAKESKIHWPVQFIVTTHSSHIANEAPFKSMRYFLRSPNGAGKDSFSTTIKDLNDGLKNTEQPTIDFLHKYMTLTRCDLLFADKAILVEGTSERLLIPAIIKQLDSAETNLSSQYISVMEVGGAFAHLFFDLIEFLKLRSLIITDLDSIDTNNENKACKVSEGNSTSNISIKKWFEGSSIIPSDLITKKKEEKIRAYYSIAYQVPETKDGPCGRSFEDAFILANPVDFDVNGNAEEQENKAWKRAKKEKNKKTEFALEYAINKTGWNVPRYIKEGLEWLAQGGSVSGESTAEPQSKRTKKANKTEVNND